MSGALEVLGGNAGARALSQSSLNPRIHLGGRTAVNERLEAHGWPPISYWLKVTVGILAIFTLADMIGAVKDILMLVLVALVLSIGFQPSVNWLVGKGLSRGKSVALL